MSLFDCVLQPCISITKPFGQTELTAKIEQKLTFLNSNIKLKIM